MSISPKQNNAKAIIDSYIELFKHLNINAGDLIPKLGLNKNWSKITDQLDVIYCGDNPGDEELAAKEYFVGRAGFKLRSFVELTNAQYEINEYAFFNKTPYSSTRTKDIEEENDPNQIIQKSIVLTVNCLFKLWKNNPALKLFVFGHSDSYIVRNFKRILIIKLMARPYFENCITILSHPSRGHLHNDIGKYVVKRLSNGDNRTINYDEIIQGIKQDEWLV